MEEELALGIGLRKKSIPDEKNVQVLVGMIDGKYPREE